MPVSKEMSKFKVGDRVAVYGNIRNSSGYYVRGAYASVHAITAADEIEIIPDDNSYPERRFTVHPKQCRRLVKKERRRVWVSLGSLYRSGDSMPVFFEQQAGCREFIEVRKK